MVLPFVFIYVFLILLLLLAVHFIIQAQWKQEKTYYFFAALSLNFVLTLFLIIIGRPQLTAILMIAGGPLSIMGLFIIGKVLETRTKLDLSAPLRGRDFLTTKGWLKLASRWGVRKTVFLYIGLALPISGGMFYLLNLSNMRNMTYVVLETITFCIVSAIIVSAMLYRNLRRIET